MALARVESTHMDGMVNGGNYIDVLVRKMPAELNKRHPDRNVVFHQVRVSGHSSGDDVFCEENKVICL